MSNAPALVEPSVLLGFAGAPFDDAAVEAACEWVRGETNWHIAPTISETKTVQSSGGPVIFVPTLLLHEVTDVRLVSSAGSSPVSWPFRPRTNEFVGGVLRNDVGWPTGVLEVDVVHGYEACPADLLPVIAAQARSARSQDPGGAIRLGSLSISGTPAGQRNATLDRYRLLSL